MFAVAEKDVLSQVTDKDSSVARYGPEWSSDGVPWRFLEPSCLFHALSLPSVSPI
jgi:hypothetical protein